MVAAVLEGETGALQEAAQVAGAVRVVELVRALAARVVLLAASNGRAVAIATQCILWLETSGTTVEVLPIHWNIFQGWIH